MLARVLVVAAIAATLVACGSRLAPVATPSPSDRSAVGVGTLLYEARFDGNDLRGSRLAGADPSASEVIYGPAWIELRILKPRGETAIAFNAPPRQNYAGDVELSVSPGSRFTLYWGLRGAVGGDLQYLLGLNTAQQSMQLTLFDRGLGVQQPVSKPMPVPGLQTGRTVRLGIVLDGGRALVYLDGDEIAQVVDGRTWAPSIPSLGIVGDDGSVRITRVRYWELP
ncbi:MAG: hypothetical protein AUH85_08865 [Chloroflexi bacterium 13_1_40CM_4_68_4]|nr:MAG: hypothetical protein AUH85_08865 [Chloroflexi bacterium 13_1_40CM_4_68_4]